MPIPLDIPPPPPPMTETDLFSSVQVPTPMNHAVLDEHDHKAFSQFLDQFFVDPNMQIDPQFTLYDQQQPPPMSLYPTEEEYHRQSNILQSLDEQKRYYHHNNKEEERPGAIYLQQSNAVTAPYIKPIAREPSSTSSANTGHSPTSTHSERTSASRENTGGGAMRRGKPHKELLTEEEKRNNHIASEQKRRSMIRSGFKDLTEIVPTLKNINNSKSTVLFKAVDFIKYLEKRNRNLREKIKNLEVRIEVEGRMGVLGRPPMPQHQQQPQYNYMSNHRTSSHRTDNLPIKHTTTTTTTTAPTTSTTTTASAALLQHKTQQRQLMELQEKLQLHQKMLAQQQQQQKTSHQTTAVDHNITRPYRVYDHQQQHRWDEKSTEPTVKMEIDNSSNAGDSLIKATVSA